MLMATIGRALAGDGDALQQLQATAFSPEVVALAVGMIEDASLPGCTTSPHAVEFAASMVLNFARHAPAEPDALGRLSEEQCLRLGLGGNMAETARANVRAACAASASRAGPAVVVGAHGAALDRLAAARVVENMIADAGAAIQLIRVIADECARSEACSVCIRELAPATLSLLAELQQPSSALGRHCGVATEAWQCLRSWVRCADVSLAEAASIPGLVAAACFHFGSEGTDNASVAEALVEAISELLPSDGDEDADDSPPPPLALEAAVAMAGAVSASEARLTAVGWCDDSGRTALVSALVGFAAELASCRAVPWTDHPQSASALLHFLAAAAVGCPSRYVFASAIEGLTGLQRLRSRLNQQQQEGAREQLSLPEGTEALLLPGLLAHARYPNPGNEGEEESAGGVEEWMRVRRDVISFACLQSYCILRHGFVGHCCAALQASLENGDWRGLEAALFVLAAAGGSIVCWIELGRAEDSAATLRSLLEFCATFDTAGFAAAATAASRHEAATAAAALGGGIGRALASFAPWVAATAGEGDDDDDGGSGVEAQARSDPAFFLAMVDAALGRQLEMAASFSASEWEGGQGGEDSDDDEEEEEALLLRLAREAHLAQSAAAVEQLCRSGRRTLATACGNDARLGAICNAAAAAATASGASGGVCGGGGDCFASLSFAACRVVALVEPRERAVAATGQVCGPLAGRLDEVVRWNQARGVSSASGGGAEATASVLTCLGACLQGLSVALNSRSPDTAAANAQRLTRTFLAGCHHQVAAAATHWSLSSHCPLVVAEALGELLCGCVGAASSIRDDATFSFVLSVATALAPGAPVQAAAVCAQASQSWSESAAASERVKVEEAGGPAAGSAAALALVAMATLLGRCCHAAVFGAAEVAGGFDEAAGVLFSAAVFLTHGGGSFLVMSSPSSGSGGDGDGALLALGRCIAASVPRPEPSLCGAALALLESLESLSADMPAAGRGGQGLALVVRILLTPLADTVVTRGGGGDDTVGKAVAAGLAGQLCGNCPEDRVRQTASSLHWLLGFVDHSEEHSRAVAAAFEGAARAKGVGVGDGSEMVRSLAGLPVEGWVGQAQALWTQMR